MSMYVDTSRLKKVNSNYKIALQSLDPNFWNTPIIPKRNTISMDTVEVKYLVTRPDRALALSNNNNFYLSFSDWSAMRPMTELEYEKACRGPMPPTYKVYNPNSNNNYNTDTTSNWSDFDWAWGNDTTLPRSNTMIGNSVLQYNGIEMGLSF